MGGSGPRLQVASNFEDSGKIHVRAREIGQAARRRRVTREAQKIRIFGAFPHDASPRWSPFSRARVYFAGIAKIRDYLQLTAVLSRQAELTTIFGMIKTDNIMIDVKK